MSGDLIELAERAEKASGPDRALDAAIALALRPEVSGWIVHPNANTATGAAAEYLKGELWPSEDGFRAWRDENADVSCCQAPAYTASLDAAMSMVPEDIGTDDGDYWRPEVARTHRGTWSAMLAPPWNSERNTTVFKSRGDPATPALALTAACLRAIAALKARAMLKDSEGCGE